MSEVVLVNKHFRVADQVFYHKKRRMSKPWICPRCHSKSVYGLGECRMCGFVEVRRAEA